MRSGEELHLYIFLLKISLNNARKQIFKKLNEIMILYKVSNSKYQIRQRVNSLCYNSKCITPPWSIDP